MALRKLLPALAGAFALFALIAFPAAAQSSLPPTPPVKLAVNPVTDKVYMANDDANTVTAFDAASGTSTTIAVGAGPRFIAVNPVTNRVYVDNADDATLSVIDGATDTLIDTYNIGSSGPITVNPITNVVYVVRMTGLGSDEVTFFNGDTDTWYTIATNSFQPNAMAVDPVTDTIYVTHYGTGDVRVIGGAFDPANDFPDSVSIGTGPHPYAIAFNPVTRKGYVITQDASSPIMVIDGADNSAVFPAVASGHGSGPQAVAVNPVTNRVYAAFSGEVVVIDGATNALTYVPIAGADTGAIALGIDYERNRIYAAASSGVLSVIDGDTDTVVRTDSIPAGTSVAALDPLTATAYFFDTTLTSLPLDGTPHAMPITASITPLDGDTSPGSGSITIDAASTFSPAALPIRGVYFRLDSQDGPWSLASGSGPWTASFSGLAPGLHTLYAFAADGQDAPLATGPQGIPLLGSIASYTFNVPQTKLVPSVSLASSANPATAGDEVTFTASVAGSSGTPTGSVMFLDGEEPLCADVALAEGSATCSASSLAIGDHAISAKYGGDAAYVAAQSAPLTQRIPDPNAPPPANLAISQSASPGSAAIGRDLVYTLAVANAGPGDASSLTIADTLPANSAFVWASAACAFASGTVTCTRDALAAGASVSFTVVVRPTAAGSVVNDASVAASEADPDTSDNAASLSTAVAASPAANAVLRYRLYNDATKEHLYTTDLNEYDTLGTQGWTQEGTAGSLLDNPGDFNGVTAVPYYRLFNDQTHWHHWTSDPNEYYTLIQFGFWHGEGVDGWILPTQAPGTTPLFRLLYPFIDGLHHWTIDQNEYDTLTTQYGWVGEGGTGFVIAP
jgi:uncharacterized repeat protein (TIGR01451 family)